MHPQARHAACGLRCPPLLVPQEAPRHVMAGVSVPGLPRERCWVGMCALFTAQQGQGLGPPRQLPGLPPQLHSSDGAWHYGVPSAVLICCLPPAQRTATPAQMRKSQSSAWLQMGGEHPALALPPMGPCKWTWMNKAPLKLSCGAQPLGMGAEMSLTHQQGVKTRSSLGEGVLGTGG